MAEFAHAVSHTPKRDILVPAREIEVSSPVTGRSPLTIHSDTGLLSKSPVSAYAADKLYEKVGNGFVTFGRTLAADGMYGLMNNILRERLRLLGNKKVLIRGLGHTADAPTRAVLSNKYKIIDTDQVLEVALPMIQDTNRFKSLGGGRSTRKDFLKFIEKSPSFAVRDMQGRMREFSLGLLFSNSEVGAGSTSYDLFASDHFCDNGIIFSKTNLASVKMVHLGAELQSDLSGFLTEEIEAVKNANIILAIQKATQKACSMKGISDLKLMIEESMRPLDVAPDKLIHEIGSKLSLTEGIQDQVMSEFFKGGNINKFGVQAAITQVAQTVETYDDRIELERVGGKVMEMSDRAWAAIQALSQ